MCSSLRAAILQVSHTRSSWRQLVGNIITNKNDLIEKYQLIDEMLLASIILKYVNLLIKYTLIEKCLILTILSSMVHTFVFFGYQIILSFSCKRQKTNKNLK
jgi:hypothetical protein